MKTNRQLHQEDQDEARFAECEKLFSEAVARFNQAEHDHTCYLNRVQSLYVARWDTFKHEMAIWLLGAGFGALAASLWFLGK